MRHALYLYGMSWRQLLCVFDLNNDLRRPAEVQVSAASFRYNSGTKITDQEAMPSLAGLVKSEHGSSGVHCSQHLFQPRNALKNHQLTNYPNKNYA